MAASLYVSLGAAEEQPVEHPDTVEAKLLRATSNSSDCVWSRYGSDLWQSKSNSHQTSFIKLNLQRAERGLKPATICLPAHYLKLVVAGFSPRSALR